MRTSGRRSGAILGVWFAAVLTLFGCSSLATRSGADSVTPSGAGTTHPGMIRSSPAIVSSRAATASSTKASESNSAGNHIVGETPAFLPTFPHKSGEVVPEVRTDGVLTRGVDGCLRLGPDGPIAIWREGHSAVVDRSGVVHIIYAGTEIARTGDHIVATGGVEQPIPPECESTAGTFSVYLAEVDKSASSGAVSQPMTSG